MHGFRILSEAARYLLLTTPRHARFYREITLPSPWGTAGARIGRRIADRQGV